MTRVRVAVDIAASPRRVWKSIEDVASHVEWMEDAVAIRFHSAQRKGVGTAFDCDTRIGPIRLVDRMEVTEWEPNRAMGIRHVGLVTGTGRLQLRRRLRGGTRFSWDERLQFPWWMGGPVGGVVGRQVLQWVWRRNVRNLKRRVEAGL